MPTFVINATGEVAITATVSSTIEAASYETAQETADNLALQFEGHAFELMPAVLENGRRRVQFESELAEVRAAVVTIEEAKPAAA